MTESIRPRRSVLYMPGANTRALEKGKSLSADALILDLEDAVSPDRKSEARDNIRQALLTGGYGNREMVVRSNGLDTPWGYDDIAMVASSAADALLLPKVESAQQVRQADALLAAAGAPETLQIWCMMETPLGILNAAEIAQASPRMAALVMGTNDLAKELNCLHTPERLPMLHSLSQCLLAARAYGLAALDGVFPDLDDEEGFRASCKQGLEFGFDGKTLIHPKTLAVCNEIFAPDQSAVAQAEKIIAAYELALAEGSAVVLVDGKLVENLHVEQARRLMSLHQKINAH